MEQSQEVVTPQTQESTTTETKSEVKNPDAVLAKNRELLAKNAELKSSIEELMTFKQQMEQQKLEKEGNLSQLVDSLRTQLNEAKEETKKVKKSYAVTSVTDQIKTLAKENGCVRPDVLLGLGGDYLSQIQVDDNFKVNLEDAKMVIDKMKEDFKDIGLFKSKDVNHTPANLTNIKTEKKGIEDMSKEELLQYWNELEKQ